MIERRLSMPQNLPNYPLPKEYTPAPGFNSDITLANNKILLD